MTPEDTKAPRMPKEILDQLFTGLSDEEKQEKLKLITELTAYYQLDANRARGERYELEIKRIKLESDIHVLNEKLAMQHRTMAKVASRCTGALDAVTAMLDYSSTGTHRMKQFYSSSIMAFVAKAKKGIENDIQETELPF